MSNPEESRNAFAEHKEHFDKGLREAECFYCNVADAASAHGTNYRPGTLRAQLDTFGATNIDSRVLVQVLSMINVEADRLNRMGVPLPDARNIVIDAAGRMIDRQRATAAGDGPLGPLVNVPVLNVPMREDKPAPIAVDDIVKVDAEGWDDYTWRVVELVNDATGRRARLTSVSNPHHRTLVDPVHLKRVERAE